MHGVVSVVVSVGQLFYEDSKEPAIGQRDTRERSLVDKTSLGTL